MAYTAQQIIDLVNQGKGPNGKYSGGDKTAELSKLHKEIAEDVLQLQGAMQEHWQGDAAGQAYAGAGPLVQASQVSGEHLTQAQGLYTGQGGSFKDLQGKVAAVGPLGDKPSDDWVSDTPLSFLSNRSNDTDAWNQKAQQVVDGYSTYHGQSADNSGRWTAPSQYGELGLPPSGADIKPTEPGAGPGSQQHVKGFGSDQDSTSNSRGGTAGHTGGVSGTNDPGRTGGSVDGGVPQQGGNSVPQPGTHVPGSQGHGGPSQSDGTSATGYRPPTTPGVGAGGDYSTTGGYGNTGFGPGGSGTGGFGPGSGSVSGFLPGGGFGPGGPGAAAGSGSGSGAGGLGAGKGSGAGALGGEQGAGSRVGGSSAGGAGRPGAPGMGAGGGMGRGGKGEGAEDSEHKTADYLLEHDPDDALIGELPKATPPVIGM